MGKRVAKKPAGHGYKVMPRNICARTDLATPIHCASNTTMCNRLKLRKKRSRGTVVYVSWETIATRMKCASGQGVAKTRLLKQIYNNAHADRSEASPMRPWCPTGLAREHKFCFCGSELKPLFNDFSCSSSLSLGQSRGSSWGRVGPSLELLGGLWDHSWLPQNCLTIKGPMC